jgi:hypothetical protein
MGEWQPDVLGPPFEQRTLRLGAEAGAEAGTEAGAEGSTEVVATLVR